jgi:hypothetical protein
MSFSKYISQTPQDFGQALQVSGFIVSNGSSTAPYTENLQRGSNDLFTGGSGIPVGTLVSSGQFHSDPPYISWNLYNPAQKKVYNDYDIPDLNFFSGFDIVLRDETGLLVQTLETGYYENYYEIDIENLKTQFSLESGRDERRFRFEVVANDYYNRTHTGVFFLTCERPDVTGLDISIGKSIKFQPKFSKVSGIDSLVLCVGTGSSFDVFSTGAENSAVAYQDINVKGQTVSNFQQNYDADLESSYYYGFYAVDIYGTGSTYIYPSSIKPLEIDPLNYNIKPSGFRGKIIVERDPINRNINSYYKGVINKDFTLEKVNYEVFVFQSGREDLESSFSIESQSISNVSFLVHGSGQNRIDYNFFTGDNFRGQDYYYSGSNSEPVFSTYNTTGIQWKEHTILLDNQSSLPGGSYTGQSPVKEIAIAAGNTNSNKIYLGVQIDPDNKEFYFYPEGGYFNSGIYTGTYAENITGGYYTYENYGPSGPSGPSGPTGPTGPASSGYAVLLAGVTGSLMATNLSGFISTNYEPNFTYDISADSDYYFKVRPIDKNGNKGTFTDFTYVSSGDIVSAISGAGYSTGLFNGDTNSGLAFYNADLDILNISDNLFSSGSGFGINVSTPEHHFHVSGDAQISGYLYDSQNTTGEAGYVLASEEGGPQWKQIEDVLSGVGGSGATNYVARWADEDTLTTGVLYDNNTNVGIGTASPAKKLHVTGDTLLESTNSGTASSLSSSATTYGLKVRGAASSGSLNFSSSNARYTLQALSTGNSAISLTLNPFGGNVGIGTVSPDTRLQIVGSTSGDSVLKVDGTNGTLFEVVDDLSDSLMSVNDAAGLPVLEVFADNHIVAGRYNQNDFYLDTNGNLGLGTSSPITKLNIKGDQSANGQLYIEPTNDSEYAGLVIKTTRGADRAYAIFAGGTGTDDLNFRFRDASAGVDRMVIDSSGKVGIGTTDPDVKLHVQGEQVYLYNDINTNNTFFYARNSSTGNAGIKMKNSQGEWTIIANDRLRFYDDDNSVERFSILSSGNVGIGTVSPTYGLEIRNSTTSQTGALYVQAALNSSGKGLVINSNTRTTLDNAEHLLQIIDRSNSDSLVTTVEGVTLAKLSTRLNTLSPLQVNSQIALGGSLYTFSTVQGGADLTLTSNANPANIGVLSNIKFKLGSSGGGGPNERMRIQSDGSIGVWNTTDIENWAGSSYRAIEFPRAALMYHTETSTDFYINSNTYYDGAWKYKSTAAASQFILGSSGDALIRTIASGTIDTGITWTTPFIVKNTGNVGIGAASPSYKLHTVGGAGVFDITGADTFNHHLAVTEVATLPDWRPYAGTTTAALQLQSSATRGILLAAKSTGNQDFYNTDGLDIYVASTIGSSSSNRGILAISAKNDGNVGIGTDDPNTKLHAYSSTAVTNERNIPIDVLTLETEHTSDAEYTGFGQGIVFRGSTYNQNTQRTLGRILHQINDDSCNTTRGTSISFQTSDNGSNANAPTTKVTIDYKGDVGIGTVSPSDRLHVIGYIKSSIGFKAANYTTMLESGNESVFGNTAYYGVLFKTNNATRMKITNAGLVGIGTVSPNAKLQVNAAISTVYANVTPSVANTIISISNIQAGETTNDQAQIQFGVNGGTHNRVGSIGLIAEDATNRKAALVFTTDDAGTRAEKMRITGDGNVGIGTTSPTGGKLQVAGKVRIDAGSGNDALNLNAYDLLKWDNANHIHFGGYKSGQWAVLKFYSSTTERLNIGSDVNVQGATDLNINGASRRLNFTSGTGTVRTTTSNNLILQTNSISAITIYPTQQVQFNAYGSGTFTGTATQRLAVDSSGNIIEIPIGSGPVDGSGAANKVTYWTDTDTISYNNNFHWDNTNGNLGIGTSAPSSTLHVSDSTSGSSVLKVDGTSGTIFEVTDDLSSSLMSVNTIAGLPVFEVFADNHIVAGRYSQNDFYLNTNGNLGLGTSSPVTKLNIKGDQSANGQLYIEPTNDSEYAGLVIKTTRGADRAYAIFAGGTGTDDLNFRFRDASAGVDRMVIDSSGNVGIGTVSPSDKLHVVQNIDLNTALFQNTSGRAQVIIDSQSEAHNSYLSLSNGGSEFAFLDAKMSINLLRIATNNTGAEIAIETNTQDEAVRIKSDGSVGIGVTNPTSGKLQVAGRGYFGPVGTGDATTKALMDTYSVLKLKPHDSNSTNMTFAQVNSGDGIGIQVTNGTQTADYDIALNPYGGNVGIGTTSPRVRLDLGSNGVSHLRWGSWSELGEESSHNSLVIGNNVYVDASATKVRATSGDGYRAIKMKYSEGITFHTTDASVTANDALGYERMRITAGGNVGIGTDDPKRPFTLYKTTNPVLQLVNSTTGTGDSDGFLLIQGDLNTTLENSEAGYMAFRTSADEKMRIDSAGDVGIGTDNPSRSLEVYRSGAVDFGLTAATSGDASAIFKGRSNCANIGAGPAQGGSNLSLYNLDPSDGNFNGVGFYNSNSLITSGILGVNVSHSSRHGALVFQTHNGSSLLERMRIDKDGDVGIGTDSPVGALEIYRTGGQIRLSGSGVSVPGFIGVNSSDKLFMTDWATGSKGVTIDLTSGNVGIGTTSPNDKLEIYGNMRVRGSDGFGANSTANYNPSYVAFPGGGKIGSSSSTETGYIKITLPQSWTSTMMQFSIDVFEYQDNKAKTFVVAGYNYSVSSSWHNASAMVLAGNDGATYKVQFGHDGSKCAIYISKGSSGASSSWTYPHVVVKDASFGFLSTDISNWIDGWSVSFSTATLSGITQTRDIQTQITGTGTSQYIPKWGSTGTALSDSVIVQNNSNIGIGTAIPSQKLHVNVGRIAVTDGYNIGDTDADTGMFPSSNALYFQTAGTTRATITSAGNVGVNTTNPTVLFVVAEGTNQHGVEIQPGSLSYIQAYDRDTSDYGDLSIDAQTLRFATDNGAERVRIDASGNVGIGTTNPGNHKLKVVGETHSTHFITGYDWAAKTGGLHIGNDGLTTGAVSFYNGSNSSANIYRNSDILYVGARAGVNTRGLAIDVNGNVGIGTANPEGNLHVFSGSSGTVTASTAANELVIEGSGDAGLNILSPDNKESNIFLGGPGLSYGGLLRWKHSDLQLTLGTNVSNAFIAFNTDSGTERMRITSAGNVGIGNTNPQGTLDLGDATGGKSIVWGGSSGTNHYSSIWSEYGTGSLVLAGGLKSSTSNADFIYPYTGTYGYAAIELDSFHDDGIKFYTAADAARTADTVATKQERMRIDTSGNVGIGTNNPAARLELIPSGNSLSGLTSKALIISNTNDTSWTADALTSYNATTGYDITDLSSLSFFARPTQGNILTFASETVNQGTVHRFVNLNSSAVEPLYRWDFYQYDGSGTGSDNFKVPDKLFQIRVREGTSEVEKFTIKGNGNIGIGTNSPAQQLHLTGSIRLPNTTNTTTGIIYKDTSRFIHNYQHPTGDTAVPAGFNTFVGLVAGNLSMGSTATSVSHGSYNSGFGYQVLNSLTTGYSNTAIGFQAGEDITTGFKNTIVGMNAGGQLVGGSRNTFIGDDSGLLTNSGINNTALGAGALRLNTTGSSNTIVGTYSLDAHTSPAGHTTLGYAALTNLTTGSYNIAIGYAAGSQRVATGNLTNSSYGIYLGYAVDGTEGASGEIVIGKDAQGLGSNTTRLGGSNITKTVIEYGNVGIGTANPSEKLDVVGNVKHEGLTMTSGTDVDQLKTFTQTLTITTSWQDTGIDGSDLTTGTYIVQLLGDDDEVGGTYSVYYSGMMSWYSSGTNDTDFTSEIALHRAGHADVGRTLYLRTVTNASGGNDLELQIAGNYNATGSDSYVFKFRRMI